MDTILELKHVSAGYDGSPVLEDVSLQVHEKDFIGVIGPNGGGKTTLLKIILGLLKPEKGEVVYHRSKHNLFGYLPQNNRFDRNFPINVTEVVLSGLLSEKGLTGRYTREDRKKAKMLLEKYGMGRYLNTPHRRAIGRTDATGFSLPGDCFFSPTADFG